jgi:type IV secretory pathway VirB2 component (pilin)
VELEEMQTAIMQGGTFAERTVAQSEFFEAHPEVLGWLIPTFILVVASGLASVGAIVCGLLGVRRSGRRGFAVAALVIAGLVPVFFCCGGLAFGAQG